MSSTQRRQDDRSPGDDREPYADSGGPSARHAQTHDVRREKLTNPTGPEPDRTAEFLPDIAPETPTAELRGHADESAPAVEDKALHERLRGFTNDELVRLPVVERGVRLDQGGTYIDLNDLERGPFKALASQVAERHNRYVAKRDVDYELWNRLAGQETDARVERPEREEHALVNQRQQLESDPDKP